MRLSTGRARSACGRPLRTIHSGRHVTLEAGDGIRQVPLPDGRTAWIAGDLYGAHTPSGFLDAASTPFDQLLLNHSDLLEGPHVVAIVDEAGERVEVRADRFGQLDLYYESGSGSAVVATSLDLLPKPDGGYDQIAFAHALTVYGTRPAKGQTYYAGVRRVGVDETACFVKGALTIEARAFQPAPAREYGDAELNGYADALLEAVRIRGSKVGNVVYLSSGWDSTSILACLVHLFGPSKVRAIIGRMTYADRSGVVNQFEIDRARAVAGFFGVPLEIVEFDYCRRGPEIIEQLKPLFRAHNLASLTGVNHALLAEHAARTGHGDEAVFAGEISDGAHNLGFSQFVTIFHPVLEFREYSDKMASYLFGPSFLRSLENGQFEQDAVYEWFRSRAGADAFDPPARAGMRTGQLLAGFFLRSRRLPLWSLANVAMLTAHGREAYQAAMVPAYLGRAAREATPETLYAWYLHLYNSFHWQGSTVATLALTARASGLRPALPFWDGRVQDFLSAMPESWGRGLDLNPTKFPLKWMLKHRVRYPMHLQVGPHSYLYDVDPRFSHAAELLYGSALAPAFKTALASRPYRDVLSPDIFNLPHLDAMVERYAGGIEVRGSELNDLMSVALMTAFGAFAGA